MSQLSQLTKTDYLSQEVLKPILYTDIFDYPLTFEEIYKYLEVKASRPDVKRLLEQATRNGKLTLVDNFYSLAGRSHLAALRQERQIASARLWPRAVYYSRWIAALPFVRLVAITGSLAVDNPRDGVDDIDYLIVTRSGRLWLCRAMIVMLVKFGHRRGIHLCPNYLITENVLDFEDDFFTARQMVQMKPVYGQDIYLDIRSRNGWIAQYFPHGGGLNLDKISDELSFGQRLFKTMSELMLGNLPGDLLEKWLQEIQISKHTKRAKQHGTLDRVVFTSDVCKGHFDGHNTKTMTAYRQRVQDYNASGNLPSKNGEVKNFSSQDSFGS